MGIFSSKKVVTAGVSVSHIVDEEPDVMRDSILTSVMTGRPISDIILANGLRGFATQVERYYQYGRDEYSLGLPESSALASQVDPAKVKIVLDAVVGAPVTTTKITLSNVDLNYVAWKYIEDTYGYNTETKKFTNPPVVGSPREFFYVNQIIDNANLVIIEYVSKQVNTPNQTGYVSFTLIGYEASKLYYNVEYYLTADATQKKKYWVYKMSSNVYPSLTIDTVKDKKIEYLPIITLIKDKKELIKEQYNEEYITATKMARAIKIDIQDVTEKIMSTENGNDPTVIDSAFLVFGANIQSDNKSTIKYLYAYLRYLVTHQATDKDKWFAWVNAGKNGDAPLNMVDIDDGRMRTTLFFNYGAVYIKNGLIGTPGTFYRTTVINPAEGEVEYSEVRFYTQLTVDTYEEFIVYGLKHVSHAYKDSIVIRTLADSMKINADLKREGGFFLPVNRTIALQLSAIDRSTMYMDSMAVVVYTVQITKVKWYQRGIFKALLVVIAIVYAVYTQDWSAVSTAAAFLQTTVSIITTLILNQLTIMALAKAAGFLGSDVAAIVATLAAIYAISQGALSTNSSLPWAKDLLSLSMLSYQGIQVDLQKDFLDTQKDFMEFIKSEQEALEDLKEKSDMFAQDINLLNLMSTQYYFNPYETPSEFYSRSVEIKNPGVLSLDAIGEFYTKKLTLPKLDISDIIT